MRAETVPVAVTPPPRGGHNGRPAFYFLIGGVTGMPVLSGEKAAENRRDNSYTLLWAGVEQFERLGLHPAGIGPVLAELLGSGA